MTALRVRRARGVRFNPETYGLLAARRRLTRVSFVLPEVHADLMPSDLARGYAPLLDDVYERMTRMSLAPLPMPERIRAEWRPDEEAFVLHGDGLMGFQVIVDVGPVGDAPKTPADEPEGAPALVVGSEDG